MSILPLAALTPNPPPFFAVGWNPGCLGRTNIVLILLGLTRSVVCVPEQGKPQHYQYRIAGDQRFWALLDGGNRYLHLPCLFILSFNEGKRLCVKLEKLDAV